MAIYTHKLDCFAYKNKQCDALIEIDCVDCSFYKPKSSIKPEKEKTIYPLR